jgi:outer membrane protein assembly factor BamB
MNRLSCQSLTTALTLFAAVSASAADWPQYRGPNLDGSTSGKIETRWPANGPRVVWRVPTPNGFSSITVADGRAYTQVARNEAGAVQEVCIALDADTGKELWAAPLGIGNYGHDGGNAGARGNDGGDGPRSTPSIDGNRVYVLSANLLLVCLDAATGKPVWRHDLTREFGARNIKWKNAASPLIDGGLVFVAGGGPGQALLAFDKATGKPAWRGQDDTMTHSTPVVADIHGTRQVIFFTEKGLVSVAPTTGTPLWRYAFPFQTSTAMTPVVAGEVVFCSAGYGVGGAAVKIGKAGNRFSVTELWRSRGNQPIANHWSTPVHKDGHLYGMFQFKEYGDGPVKCVEIATGRVKWEQPGFGPGNVILAGNHLVALSDDGQLVLLEANPDAYREVARAKVLSGKCWSTPTLSNGRIYARSTREAICVDVSSKSTAR